MPMEEGMAAQYTDDEFRAAKARGEMERRFIEYELVDALNDYIDHEYGFASSEASNPPAHIVENEPNQQEIDRRSARMLYTTSITDAEWDAHVRHAKAGAIRDGELGEELMVLKKIAKALGRQWNE